MRAPNSPPPLPAPCLPAAAAHERARLPAANCISQDNVAKTPFVPPVGAMSKFSAGVVWLHGLGDTGAGWSFLQGEIGGAVGAAVGGAVKWIFPTAPTAGVTCNGGFEMTSWMDLEDIPVAPVRPAPLPPSPFTSPEQRRGSGQGCKDAVDDIKASMEIVHGHVDSLVAEGIPPEKIVIGGFSQGGCMALASTLGYSKRLAGGVVLSGWLAMEDQYPGAVAPANKATPLLWGHGGADPTVLTACQAHGIAALQKAGCTVEKATYPGLGHGSSPQEIEDVKDFLSKVLSA